jgi:hypothetical protein
MILRTTIITIFILGSFYTDVNATVRYVKAGNPTSQAPYTTWATAADSIQKCVNISQRGDTIYVGTGVYREYIHNITSFLTIIGEEMESTIINCSGIKTNRESVFLIESDSLQVKNFTLIGNRSDENDSLIKKAFLEWNWSSTPCEIRVFECKLEKFNVGMEFPKGIFQNNFVIDVDILLNSYSIGNYIDSISILNNLFVHPLYSMHHFIYNGVNYPRIFIRNNIFVKPFVSSDFYNQLILNVFSIDPKVEFSNNLFYTKSYNSDDNPFVPANGTMAFYNNVFCVSEGPNREYRKDFMTSSGNVTFTNNVVYGFDKGIWNSSPNLKVNNNCFWNVPTPLSGTQPPLINSENLSVNPMFVKDYGDFPNVDFHLQMYSPLIDAGDSTILDKDGTRSDIGFYGGPYGESYTYQDYAPRVPARVNLRSTGTPGVFELSWRPITEADFNR